MYATEYFDNVIENYFDPLSSTLLEAGQNIFLRGDVYHLSCHPHPEGSLDHCCQFTATVKNKKKHHYCSVKIEFPKKYCI